MAEIINVLTDREALVFIGAKNIRFIESKFWGAGLQPSGQGWPVKQLCKVYDVDQHLAAERLNKFITAGRIAGPLLMR